MSDSNLVQELAALFKETGHAHHQAFIETDGADPEWPIWYAGYLQDKLIAIFNKDITQSTLVYLLVRAEKEHTSQAPESDWMPFYAKLFIAYFR